MKHIIFKFCLAGVLVLGLLFVITNPNYKIIEKAEEIKLFDENYNYLGDSIIEPMCTPDTSGMWDTIK